MYVAYLHDIDLYKNVQFLYVFLFDCFLSAISYL